MCTLVVSFYPKTKTPLVIASNRDENPNRLAEPWALRSPVGPYVHFVPQVYCPLDVLGGTWIGTNSAGIFCAITNWDLDENFHGRGLKSRGHLVLKSLTRTSITDVVEYWAGLDAREHKPFNMVAGTANDLYNLSCDNKELIVTKLRAGVHISTGIGFNQKVPRDTFIRKNLLAQIKDFSQPVCPSKLLKLMGSHDCGIGSEDSVCVHDNEHRWETRSTAMLINDERAWKIRSKDGPACNGDNWTTKTIKL
jgi:uncharacterized protein with NRDE domain